MTIAIHRIEYLAVEVSPLDSPMADPGIDSWIEEFSELPQAFEDVLTVIVEQQDCARCSSCENAIGYVLWEDDDYPERSGLSWEMTYLVRVDDGPVAVVCENCAPLKPSPGDS